MSESLGDMLRRSADAAPEPRVDVAELVAQAGQRQRRRRLAAVGATTAAVVGAVVVGALGVRGGQPGHPEPARSPSPSVVDPQPTAERPLVYAAGSTVHVGDDTVEAGGTVAFVDATDDGVLFVTEDSDGVWDSDTLWFSDGSTTQAIGRVPTEHIGYFDVWTADPGSLVVWADATSRRKHWVDRFLVYDTSRHAVVARLPFTGVYNVVLHVDEAHVFFNPDSGAPGCWVIDIHYCKGPHLLRFDLDSGETRKISRTTFDEGLRTIPRMLVLAESRGDTGTVFTARGMARFNQVGRRLVPVDSNGDPTEFTLTTGQPVALRVPPGYRAPGDEMRVTQWIDDDRLVLFPNEGGGDLPPQVGDLLECRLPDGTCRVAVRASSTPYVAPG